MKKLFLFLFLGIFLISLTSAFSYEQYSRIDIKISIDNSTSACNITVSSKNTSNVVENQEMTIGVGYANYSIIGYDLGTYQYFSDCGSGNFEITPTGYSQTTAQAINSLGYLSLMIFLTILLGILGFTFKDSERLWVLGIFFIFLSIILMIYDFWMGYEFHKNLTGINNGSSLQEMFFVIFMGLFGMGMAVAAVLLFKNWKKIFKWWRQVKEEAKREQEEKDENLFD